VELHTANSGMVRRFNEAAVLEVLRKHRLLTKTDIVKLTGLTYPTVSKSISSLHEAMLIQESGEGASRGGRPPLLYSFNPRAGVIVGVQIEKKRLSLGAFDLDLRLIDDLQFQVSSLKPADIIILIKKGVQEIARNQAEGVLYGVGIGSPGNIDPVDNTVVSPYQLRWRTPVDLIHQSRCPRRASRFSSPQSNPAHGVC
jgi:predicted transcriptional regulator